VISAKSTPLPRRGLQSTRLSLPLRGNDANNVLIPNDTTNYGSMPRQGARSPSRGTVYARLPFKAAMDVNMDSPELARAREPV